MTSMRGIHLPSVRALRLISHLIALIYEKATERNMLAKIMQHIIHCSNFLKIIIFDLASSTSMPKCVIEMTSTHFCFCFIVAKKAETSGHFWPCVTVVSLAALSSTCRSHIAHQWRGVHLIFCHVIITYQIIATAEISSSRI